MCELIPTELVLRDATQIKARYLNKANGNQSAWRYLDKSKNSRKCRSVHYQSKKKKEWMIINIQNNPSDGMHLHLISDVVKDDS